MKDYGKEIRIYDVENLPFGRPVNLERNGSFEKGIVIKDSIALPNGEIICKENFGLISVYI
jgi:hypothetical protein